MLVELSRCTEKFLEEASKYGEVSYYSASSLSRLKSRVRKVGPWSKRNQEGWFRNSSRRWWEFSIYEKNRQARLHHRVLDDSACGNKKLRLNRRFEFPNNVWILAPQRPLPAKFRRPRRKFDVSVHPSTRAKSRKNSNPLSTFGISLHLVAVVVILKLEFFR